MILRWTRLALGVAFAVAWGSPARAGGDLRRLFPQRADVVVPAGEGHLARLEILSNVLTACKADLSDLRLLDSSGEQIPYLVDRAPLPPRSAIIAHAENAKVTRSDRSLTRRNVAPPLVRETYEIAAPRRVDQAPTDLRWDLAFEVASKDFVRRLDVEGIDGARTVPLVHDASLFRLARSGAERLTVALPADVPPALRIVLTGEGTEYLEPRLHFESVKAMSERAPVIAPLLMATSRHAGGKSETVFTRALGVVPSALHFESTTPLFDRAVEVFDLGAGAKGERIGSGRLFRVQALTALEQVDLPIAVPRGDRLRVEIDDGDSPPLATLKVSAIVRQPNLVFAAPPSQTESKVATLYFGGGRAHLPRYDLGTLLPDDGEVFHGRRAQAAASLYDSAAARGARLGETQPNPDFDAAPALSFLVHPGAPIDDRLYTHARALEIAPSEEGVARVDVHPSDAAVARSDFADLRIVDGEGRQWPYLLESDAGQEWVSASVVAPDRHERTSRYSLSFPSSPVVLDRIEIETPEPYFDRHFTLTASDADGKKLALAEGRFVRKSTDEDPEPLTVEIANARVKVLELAVDDGEEESLKIRSVRVRIPLPALHVAARAGRYRLLLGNPGDAPPSYDISRARDLVLAVRSELVKGGPLGNNASYQPRARLVAGQGPYRALVWGALGLAVITLAALTLRLARSEGEPPTAGT